MPRLVRRIFHANGESRDSHLIFSTPLAKAHNRARSSHAVAQGRPQASRTSAMAALQGTAIVVGVGSEQGLGAALSRRFAREGYNVVVSGRTEAKLARVVRTIIMTGAKRRQSLSTRRSRRMSLRCLIGPRLIAPMVSISWYLMRATMPPTISAPCPRRFSSRRGVSLLSAGFWSDGKPLVAWRRVAGARSFSQVPPRVYAGVRRLPHSHRPRRDYGRLRSRWRGNLDRLEFTSAMLSSMAELTAKG